VQNNRPVPGIANLNQGFSRKTSVPIPSPLGNPQQQFLPTAIDDPADDLAQEIYARLAVQHLSLNLIGDPSPITLQRLADHARAAARAYFEGSQS
jgi:hypothetical protein